MENSISTSEESAISHHDHHESDGYPAVHDEAGDTPMWVPLLGLVFLILLFVAGFLSMRDTTSTIHVTTDRDHPQIHAEEQTP